MEASADPRILVRKITDVHANYSVRGDGEEGQFSFQLILDDGAQEVLALPNAEASKVMLRLLQSSKTAYFDLDKHVVVFRGVDG